MAITPKDNENFFPENTVLVSKTDLQGKIRYASESFLEIVGFQEAELIGKPHNIIRHPDMPKVVFKLLWDALKAGREVHAYVKNLTKDGSYYWVFANVTPSLNNKFEVIGYHSARRKPSPDALEVIKPLYKELLMLEKSGGVSKSEAHLNALLASKGVEYEEFILSI